MCPRWRRTTCRRPIRGVFGVGRPAPPAAPTAAAVAAAARRTGADARRPRRSSIGHGASAEAPAAVTAPRLPHAAVEPAAASKPHAVVEAAPACRGARCRARRPRRGREAPTRRTLADIDSVIADTDAEAATGAAAVTEALARLADLRDSGAITDEDYEAKKQELLDRL